MWGSYNLTRIVKESSLVNRNACTAHCSSLTPSPVFFLGGIGWHSLASTTGGLWKGHRPNTLENEDLEPIQKWWVHPGRITWNTIMEVWKIIFLSKWVICRFHVNLPGCIGIGSEDFPCKRLRWLRDLCCPCCWCCCVSGVWWCYIIPYLCTICTFNISNMDLQKRATVGDCSWCPCWISVAVSVKTTIFSNEPWLEGK